MTDNRVFLDAQNLRVEFALRSRGPIVNVPVGGHLENDRGRHRLIAVEDVSFSLREGDSLGLLGHNGSGKTTLLRLLSGIYLPTSGTIISRGVIGNALNTGLGFRQEATGRRNIVLKALIAGYKYSEMGKLIEDVEAFAELGPFLDEPLYTYSAGMRARLTFGVATALRCDILILDEWLGAGDKGMQDKVAERMSSFVKSAAITVVASHSAGLLKRICNKGLVMDHGRMAFFGDIEAAIGYYQ